MRPIARLVLRVVLVAIPVLLWAADWDEGRSLRAYDGPPRPKEQVAHLSRMRAMASWVVSIDGKTVEEYAKVSGQEILADTPKNRFRYSPYKRDFPTGYVLLPGEHDIVISGQTRQALPPYAGWHLRFIAEPAVNYSIEHLYEAGEMFRRIEKGESSGVVILKKATKDIVSTEIPMEQVQTQ